MHSIYFIRFFITNLYVFVWSSPLNLHYIYIGANVGESSLNDVWRSNNLGTSWLRYPNNADWVARSNMGAVSIGGIIIVMGGQDRGRYICSSLIFCGETKS